MPSLYNGIKGLKKKIGNDKNGNILFYNFSPLKTC